ncbi:n-acetylglucosamine-1-phosphotransferase subunits alpha beta [Nannochloropsis gaditana]|uniref:N-acetylglucosamine-1-phosphotransferase subunits alpha beta n=1 Tax=Nannochloropsis gaditana TaxID=72520 RepID=W7TSF4_9STRA|nr:n-acetylglucosamine-1-phosphotransferase subunits alpha beta [Nannochloropsis gaditana]
MPHLIDKELVTEMQARWKEEWDRTSQHRFRAADDMQYSFSYFYYLMNLQKAHPLDLKALWYSDIDVDGDGFLDDNELVTLAALGMGRDPTYGYLMKIKDCMLGGGRREGLRGGGDGREGRRRLQRSAAGEEERREGEREAKLEVAGWGSAQLEERDALGSRGKDEIRGGRGGGGGAEGGGGKEAEEEEGEGIGAPGSGPLEEEEGGEGDKEGRKEREGTAESGDDGGDRPAEEQALPSEETKISLEHFLGCQQILTDLEKNVRRKGPWTPGPIEDVRQD